MQREQYRRKTVDVDDGCQHVVRCCAGRMQDNAQRLRPSDEINERIVECGCVARGQGETRTNVQSQNDYSTAQLNVMGYRGDVLRAQFCPDKIREMKASGPVTVANTRERQEALAAAHTHGKKFL